MAKFHGKSGTVTFGAAVLNVINFSFDATADVAETTAMADTYKGYVAGYKDWTAVVECRLDTAGVDPDLVTDLGGSASLDLDTVTGKHYSGTAICTNVGVNQPYDGVPTVTYNFQGSGTLTEGA